MSVKKLSGAAGRKRTAERLAREAAAEVARRALAADRRAAGLETPNRFAALLSRRPSTAFGLSAWVSEAIGEEIASVIEETALNADDRRRWLRDLGRTFAACAPRGATEATLKRLEHAAKLTPPSRDAELDHDTRSIAPVVKVAPEAPLAPLGTGELVHDPEVAQ